MSPPKRINLALQGGGSHGAFTWGVLDRLLAEPRLEIEGLSGTSAGAMNAAVLAAGYANGGRDGAREALAAFWARVATLGALGPFQPTPWDRVSGHRHFERSPGFAFFDMFSRAFSPYEFNPLNLNPLRALLDEAIDYDLVRHQSGLKLFVAATNVQTGKARVFSHRDLSTAVLLASSALPFLFQAVEIEGEAYYDGGYSGNPCIYPLIYNCEARDVVIVQINPLRRDEIPTTARDVVDRINEISFNNSLVHEMRAIHFVTRLIDSGALDGRDYKRMNMHMVEASADMSRFGAASKMNTDRSFLEHLRSVGGAAASRWIEQNFEAVGERSSLDIARVFL
ncbi:MAG: patatin-like phospholipase family protein [Alphaproteobacteria bacterium]|nr:patatin-like phospholipase family protein [Alphaproteobacteria bacterium]